MAKENNYTFEKPDNFSCEFYWVMVSANTDIGQTNFSEAANGYFPTGMVTKMYRILCFIYFFSNQDIEFVLMKGETFIENITRHECGRKSTYEIIGKVIQS